MCECTREKLAALQAERDGWKIACEAAQKVARDNEAELAEARALLREVYDYLESLKFTPNPNAPGHRHNIPGRWDGDGAACTWCATWSRVRACVQQPDIHHRGTEATENG
jgi:hypothetical protein